jgi:hypothetical protein
MNMLFCNIVSTVVRVETVALAFLGNTVQIPRTGYTRERAIGVCHVYSIPRMDLAAGTRSSRPRGLKAFSTLTNVSFASWENIPRRVSFSLFRDRVQLSAGYMPVHDSCLAGAQDTTQQKWPLWPMVIVLLWRAVKPAVRLHSFTVCWVESSRMSGCLAWPWALRYSNEPSMNQDILGPANSKLVASFPDVY